MEEVHDAIEPSDRVQRGGGGLHARDEGEGCGGGGGLRAPPCEDPAPDGARAAGPVEGWG